MTGFQSCEGGGNEQLLQGKLQLPKGEPQAHAPGARQAPTRPLRRRGRAKGGARPRARDCEPPAHTLRMSKVQM